MNLSDFEIIKEPFACILKKYNGTDKIVKIPSDIDGTKITTIGSYSFMGSSMEGVIIPKGVTSINIHAFGVCINLKTVVMPDTIKYIERTAFYRCESLNKIIFKGTPEQWKKITNNSPLANSVKVIYDTSSKLSSFLNIVSDLEEIEYKE